MKIRHWFRKLQNKLRTNRMKLRLQARFLLLATVCTIVAVAVMVISLNSMTRSHTDNDAYTKIDYIESRNGILDPPDSTPSPGRDDTDDDDDGLSTAAPDSVPPEPREKKGRRMAPDWQSGRPWESDAPGGEMIDYIFASINSDNGAEEPMEILLEDEALTEQEARTLAWDIIGTGKTEGRYKGKYHFKIWNDGVSVRLVAMNTTVQQNYDNSTLDSSIKTGAIVVGVTFVLFCLLSGPVVRPFTENLKKQKQFITDASHEIKTPLTIIAANVDVLEMTGMEDNKWLQSIKNQTGRLNKMVKSLVLLARTDEDGDVGMVITTLDLSAAACRVWDSFAPLFEDQGISARSSIEEGIQVNGDEFRLKQMISIFCENGLKYTAPGGTFVISLRRRGRRAVLECFNTCESPEKIDTGRIFDRFYRSDESHNSQTGGNGIGLSVAKAIAENHKGRIWASVRENIITFTVEISCA